MRTTLRIDDDLLRQLKRLAEAESVPLAELVNRVLRQGLGSKPVRKSVYREQTFSMGQPRTNIDKGLALADSLEEEEIARKLALRK